MKRALVQANTSLHITLEFQRERLFDGVLIEETIARKAQRHLLAVPPKVVISQRAMLQLLSPRLKYRDAFVTPRYRHVLRQQTQIAHRGKCSTPSAHPQLSTYKSNYGYAMETRNLDNKPSLFYA